MALGLLLTGVLVGCGSTSAANQPLALGPGLPSVPNHATLDASWAGTFSTLKAYRDNSIVVAGTFTAVVGSGVHPQSHVPFTDYSFVVRSKVHDPKGQLAQTIAIHQQGGVQGDTLYEMGDDPMFTVGAQAVLFLHEYEPGKFFVLGGPYGRYNIANGKLAPQSSTATIKAANSEAAFIAQIQAA